MSANELEALMPPPSAPRHVPTADDWRAAEKVLGTELPRDYKEFVGAYGSGKIDDFLWILNPASPNRYGNLISYWREQGGVFEYMQAGSAPLRYALYPASPGLLPVGQTDNGDTLYFLCSGAPETWQLAWLPSRGRDVRVFDMGLSEFLVAALEHQLEVFPRDLAADFVAVDE